MSLEELVKHHRDQILSIASKYGASNIRVFGSVATGDTHSSSEIDLLVDLDPDRSLFDLGGLIYELNKVLGVDVDVVTPESLHWYIRDKVLEEAIEIK
ncbi:MAG: nucleotidyltransferase family protein [Anaerolineaceae bacterium]|nr:nucleotidyltransferase family protein [Anaerolineaceae bacterium]